MNDLTQLLAGILSQYFIKLKKASLVAWSTLITISTLLFAAFSGTLGVELPENWVLFIQKYQAFVLPVLVVILQAIAMAKDALITQTISEAKSNETNTRGLLANENPTIDLKKLEKALKI